MKKKLLILLTFVCIVALAACSKGGNEENATPTPTEAAEATKAPEPTAEPTPEPTAEPAAEPTAEPSGDGKALEEPDASGKYAADLSSDGGEAEIGTKGDNDDEPIIIDNPGTSVWEYEPDEEAKKRIEAFADCINGYIAENPENAETACIMTVQLDGDGIPEILLASTDEDDAEYYFLKYDAEKDVAVRIGPFSSDDGLMIAQNAGLFMTSGEKEDGTVFGVLYALNGFDIEDLGDMIIDDEEETVIFAGETLPMDDAEEKLINIMLEKSGITDRETLLNGMEVFDGFDCWNVEVYDGARVLLEDLFRWDAEEGETLPKYTSADEFYRLEDNWYFTGGSFIGCADETEVELDADTEAVFCCDAQNGTMEVSVNSATLSDPISDTYMTMNMQYADSEGEAWYVEGSSDDDDRHYAAGLTDDDSLMVIISVSRELGEDQIVLNFSRVFPLDSAESEEMD